MDEPNLYLQKAENELIVAELLFEISHNEALQKEQFKLEKQFTFYSSVINHAYYSIFYAAKAILITKTAIFPILKGGVFNMRFLGLKTIRLKCGVLNPDSF